MSRTRVIAPVVLGLALIASIILYAVTPRAFDRRLLRFPDTAGGEPHAEWHLVPHRDSREDQIRMLVAEIKLGPVELGAVPYLPQDARIRNLVLRDGEILYLDFSPDVMFGDADAEGGFSEIDALLRRTLRHNFGWLDEIRILIAGQVPEAPRFGEIGR